MSWLFSRALVEAFSGGGLLGWRTICAVEWEPYAASVLAARQNDGILPPFPVWDDVRTFDGRPWRGRVDVVSGGFPCQDISVAGKGAGIEGERSGMWTHMARIVGEVQPRYVFVENSPAILTRGLGRVLGDLATLGYDCRWTVLGAADVGAPHQRDRFWLVATFPDAACGRNWAKHAWANQRAIQNSTCGGICKMAHADSLRELQPQGRQPDQWGRPSDCGAEVRDPDRQGLAVGKGQPSHDGSQLAAIERADWWQSEPDVGRVVNGVAARVDRLKAIGNGQVPLCAATAWRLLTA
jgi:DNA (cytosine-5)-methyltransferase 1